jgi:hypothetical protein
MMRNTLDQRSDVAGTKESPLSQDVRALWRNSLRAEKKSASKRRKKSFYSCSFGNCGDHQEAATLPHMDPTKRPLRHVTRKKRFWHSIEHFNQKSKLMLIPRMSCERRENALAAPK